MPIRVDQFHTAVSTGASVGSVMLNLQQMLRSMGYISDLFCEHLPTHFEGQTKPMQQYLSAASSDDVILLHYSLNYSQVVMDWLRQIPARKVLVYHNITPHTYFLGINPVFLEAAHAGRQRLSEIATQIDVAWGFSEFNCQELESLNFADVRILPIIFNPDQAPVRPDRKVLQARGDVNILTVGRISPNKCLEDVILTFYYIKQQVSPSARLTIVGAGQGMEPYVTFLQTLVQRLQLSDVEFTGHVSAAQLAAHYQNANIYLSMSAHEGFGIPLLEAMQAGVPVIAYKAGAVPETMGDSGVMVTQKSHAAIAELIGVILEDSDLRKTLVQRQHDQLRNFSPDTIRPILAERLKTVIAP